MRLCLDYYFKINKLEEKKSLIEREIFKMYFKSFSFVREINIIYFKNISCLKYSVYIIFIICYINIIYVIFMNIILLYNVRL